MLQHATASQHKKKKKKNQTTNPTQQNKKTPPQPHENLYCDTAFAKKTCTDCTAFSGVSGCSSRVVPCTPVANWKKRTCPPLAASMLLIFAGGYDTPATFVEHASHLSVVTTP